MNDSPEKSLAWLRYRLVLGTLSVVELVLDPLVAPSSNRLVVFSLYVVVKCVFLLWCMAPVHHNGSDLIFNQVTRDTNSSRLETNRLLLHDRQIYYYRGNCRHLGHST